MNKKEVNEIYPSNYEDIKDLNFNGTLNDFLEMCYKDEAFEKGETLMQWGHYNKLAKDPNVMLFVSQWNTLTKNKVQDTYKDDLLTPSQQNINNQDLYIEPTNNTFSLDFYSYAITTNPHPYLHISSLALTDEDLKIKNFKFFINFGNIYFVPNHCPKTITEWEVYAKASKDIFNTIDNNIKDFCAYAVETDFLANLKTFDDALGLAKKQLGDDLIIDYMGLESEYSTIIEEAKDGLFYSRLAILNTNETNKMFANYSKKAGKRDGIIPNSKLILYYFTPTSQTVTILGFEEIKNFKTKDDLLNLFKQSNNKLEAERKEEKIIKPANKEDFEKLAFFVKSTDREVFTDFTYDDKNYFSNLLKELKTNNITNLKDGIEFYSGCNYNDFAKIVFNSEPIWKSITNRTLKEITLLCVAKQFKKVINKNLKTINTINLVLNKEQKEILHEILVAYFKNIKQAGTDAKIQQKIQNQLKEEAKAQQTKTKKVLN